MEVSVSVRRIGDLVVVGGIGAQTYLLHAMRHCRAASGSLPGLRIRSSQKHDIYVKAVRSDIDNSLFVIGVKAGYVNSRISLFTNDL